MTGPDHLDDDAISAVLDGEGTADESRHVDGCEACSTRLEALRDASMLVRSPVPAPDPARTEAAIGAALAAASTPNGTVVPFRRRLPPAWLAAAAAAVVVVVLGIAVFPDLDSGDDDSGDSVALSDDDSAGDPQTMATGAADVPDAGFLGELEGADLREVVETTLGDRRSSAEAPASDGVGGGDADEGAESDAALRFESSTECDAALREDTPDLGDLVLRGSGTFQDDPVVVLVYTVDREERVERWVFVLGVEDCVIRNVQTFPVDS